jgi:hypothetical protein
MRLKELKDLIKKSMVEVAPKKDSGAMNPEEEENAAAAMAAINRYEKEKKEMDLTSGPTVVPGAVPMREGSNIPDDIEWEWDGQVLDQVDSYSAEIGLEGYSPSTGHSFTASVPAYDNGGDWEWNEGDIDFIEQAPMEEDILREADDIVAAYAEKKTLKEADLSQANFSDLNQVVRNIAHVNEVRMEEAAMQAIEYIAEQFDVPVDFKDFN